MKIDSIKSSNNIYSQQKKDRTSFKGSLNPLADGLVKTMEAIDRGGLFASFTIQDNLGTNIPRTYAGLHRNENKTGKLNYKAALEEALREYMTGPSMFLIPAAIFLGTKKFWGKSTSVDFNLLDSFKENYKNINIDSVGNRQLSKQNFFKNVVKSVTDDEKAVDEISSSLSKISDLKKTDFATKKEYKAAISEIYGKITDSFARVNKKNAEDAISPSLIKIASGEKTFVKDSHAFAKQAVTFANDVVEKTAKGINDTKLGMHKGSFEELVEKGVKKVKGAKFISSLVAIGAVFSFMTIIPKIYSRNKTYPGSEGLIKTDAQTTAVNNNSNAESNLEKGAQNASK